MFYFFFENVDQNHWTMSCLCNPWDFIQKAMKKKEQETLIEKFEHVDENFIHGWLHFDPLDQGFLQDDEMTIKHKKF